ncbi:MAG: MBOAT family protein, partial [Deltaproteobacteria bacterium]|nr:MBOAT family protein [Deltaproteobacteria bacterium]
MLFNSLEYALFLALVFFAFWGLGRAQAPRTVLLLGASYLFYMSWNASFVFLLAASTLVDYWIGNALARRRDALVRRALVTGSIVLNLGLLAVFKYLDFGLSAVSTSLSGLGLHVAPMHLGLIVPVGISFYTFQTLSYTIDIYRGRLAPANSFLDFATYVAFFPQLIAGPIVRASEFLPQLERPPRLDAYRAGSGMVLIFRGLTKKVLVADFLAVNWIDRVFDTP